MNEELDITPCWAKGYGGEQEKIYCGQEYAKAAGLGVRPLPCVRDEEHGEKEKWTIYDIEAVMHEEDVELEVEIEMHFGEDELCGSRDDLPEDVKTRILDEWADKVIASTSAVSALLGVSWEELEAAIIRGNERNHKRGRL